MISVLGLHHLEATPHHLRDPVGGRGAAALGLWEPSRGAGDTTKATKAKGGERQKIMASKGIAKKYMVEYSWSIYVTRKTS